MDGRAVPHLAQNLDPSGIAVPHALQNMSHPSLFSESLADDLARICGGLGCHWINARRTARLLHRVFGMYSWTSNALASARAS